MGTGVGTAWGSGTAAAAAGSVAAGVATGSAFAGATVATGAAAAGFTVAAGTATAAGVTGTAAGVVVTAGTNVPTATGAGVVAGLAAAVLTGTGVAAAAAAGVRSGARSEEVAMVAWGEVTAEAVAGVIVRVAGGGEGLSVLPPMPNVSKRPPKKPSGGMGGMKPGCALTCDVESRMLSRQRSRAGCERCPIHLCWLLLPFSLRQMADGPPISIP